MDNSGSTTVKNSGSTTVKTLKVVLSADNTKLQSALSQAEKATKSTASAVQTGATQVESATARMQSSLAKVAKLAAAAVSVKAIVDFGKSCVQLGSDLSEVQNVVDVTFGSMSGTIDDFAKSAIDTFGLSETAAKKYASTLGAMVKSMGLSMDTVTEMSTTVAGLAGDMASFYNISSDEAFSKLRAGISGEAEPLKQLGINMSQANLEAFALSKGMTTAYSAMSQAEQVTLRYQYILDATSDAQGDVARTTDSWANQVRRLNMQFESIKANVGQGLIVALTPVIKVINDIISKIAELSAKFRDFMQSFGLGSEASTASVSTDVTIENATDTGDALGDTLDAAASKASKVGKNLADGMDSAVASAKGFLMSFDEIHAMQGSAASNALGATTDDVVEAIEDLTDSTALANMRSMTEETQDEAEAAADMAEAFGELSTELSPVQERAEQLIDTFKDGFGAGIGDNVTDRIDSITDHVGSIGKSIADTLTASDVQDAADEWADSVAGALGKVAGVAGSIGLSIGENLLGGIDGYLSEDGERISDRVAGILDAEADTADTAGDLAVSIAEILEPIGGKNGTNLTKNLVGTFGNAFLDVTTLASKARSDIAAFFAKPITMNTESLQTAFDGLLENASIKAAGLKQAMADLGDTVQKTWDEHFSPFFESMGNNLAELTDEWLTRWNSEIQPKLKEWAEDTQTIFISHFAPAMKEVVAAMGDVADLLSAMGDKLTKAVKDAMSEDAKKENGVLTRVLEGLDLLVSSGKAVGAAALDTTGDLWQMMGAGAAMWTAGLTGDETKRWEAEQRYNEGIAALGDHAYATAEALGTMIASPGVAAINASSLGRIEVVSDFTDAMIGNMKETIGTQFVDTEKETEKATGILGQIENTISEKLPDGMSLSEGVHAAVEEMKTNPQKVADAIASVNATSTTPDASVESKEQRLSFNDIVSAVTQAIDGTARDMIIYMDGEEVGRGITKALNTANIRSNPQIAFGY